MPRILNDPVQRDAARRLRRDMTNAERVLWAALRHDALGVRFRRQHPIGRYVADFACVEAKLVVEIDGGQHGCTLDAERDAAMQRLGWMVLRYWNNEVLENRDGMLADIARVARGRTGAR
ncbi:endonuclease domain-containing protein [Falsiroseomonas oryziterrae]|uniref:endonuclease domain-containing protein n=1 Tax=Falsiroseomonas oryziterrae TaxID=2911368 RepID=UPI001F17D336|nr:endonuclease domain-containing protein [Roseomonas sp. NPKOSM-4]